MSNTPWCGRLPTAKLFLQSGQFSSTLLRSFEVISVDTIPTGIDWDHQNTPWIGSQANKLYLQSDQFFSPVKFSFYVGDDDTNPFGIAFNGTDTLWGGGGASDKLYLQSGQFYSEIHDSEYIGPTRGLIRGITSAGANTIWADSTGSDDQLILQAGQFTSDILKSFNINFIDTDIRSNSWDGTNTPWVGNQTDKLYLQSGQFFSEIKDSVDITTWSTSPSGISTNNYIGRIGLGEETISNSLSLSQSLASPIIRPRTITNSLSLSQVLLDNMVRPRTIINSLSLGQTITKLILPDCSVQEHWNRWIYASVTKHFSTESAIYALPVFLEGTNRLVDGEQKFIECRVSIPSFSKLHGNYYKLDVVVNILWTFNQDDEDFHEPQRISGIITNMMGNICIYRYGNGIHDDDTLLGQLQQKGAIRAQDFGQIRQDVRLMQGVVVSNYTLDINCTG
ncbi:hypothetical protein LCGC14_1539860 [marine sediment metagenome]|uniref:Uncharacterized protein n=1 Tax=marine sediment metagenome TaxID=412755 RepID=A0A0F9ITH8_9ZZZZ